MFNGKRIKEKLHGQVYKFLVTVYMSLDSHGVKKCHCLNISTQVYRRRSMQLK